ncbi:DNA repair protein RecN [Weissella coleopterorum]|uniref:DNA repair protein RecN n=1 Tax=Weissella coleopterorum TaxID=2714949 RepID=A0A6G8AZL1_9LACO|nr:DNA repair protein RecN [Weissella coleopterorum]QIL50420.1 DNA repair protein RecN [Weissella coleopterorum]
MLQELSIKDFAIIPTLDLSFENGMTVLTGETGAGKSIIIDAVGLLVGGRSSVDYIRDGTKKATLQGLFSVDVKAAVLPALEEYGVELDDNQVLISREIHQNGRNVIRINGVMINGTGLKKIGRHLVDIHGQNEHQELMKVERHEFLLDQFAQNDVVPILVQYQQAYDDYQKYFKLYQQRKADEQAFAQRLDMLTFQVNELQEADLKVNEEALLNQEYQELSNFQDVLEALSTAYEALAGDWEGNGLEVISRSVTALEGIEELSSRYQSLTEMVRGAYFELQEAASDALSVRDGLEFDAERLNEVTERLNLINTLENKYGTDIPEVLSYQAKIEGELAEMTVNGSTLSDLKQQMLAAKKAAQKLADQLTQLRKVAAIELTKAIHQQLADLFMEKAVFSVNITPTKNLQTMGQDQIEFYIQTNPGESAKPLAKIASGGELSRMMLAMKTIFAHDQGVTSIVFDEVDTGVSGRVAQAIANKIAKIASYSQVLTITHLPQVAAVADQHLYIEKKIIKQRTVTSVQQLDQQGRIDELARMLSGDQLTDAARANARDLLNKS